MDIFVFDIETISNVESGQCLYDLHGLSDGGAGKAMPHTRQQKTESEFLPLHRHHVCAISGISWKTE